MHCKFNNFNYWLMQFVLLITKMNSTTAYVILASAQPAVERLVCLLRVPCVSSLRVSL